MTHMSPTWSQFSRMNVLKCLGVRRRRRLRHVLALGVSRGSRAHTHTHTHTKAASGRPVRALEEETVSESHVGAMYASATPDRAAGRVRAEAHQSAV